LHGSQSSLPTGTSRTESRSLNLHASYQWADSVPNIDISQGLPILHRETGKPKPSKLRLCIPSDSSASNPEARRHAGPQSHASDPPIHTQSTTPTSPQSFLNRHQNFTGNPSQTKGSQRPCPLPLRPGDRYPTTSLTPPDTLKIDEAKRWFSRDNDTVVGSGS